MVELRNISLCPVLPRVLRYLPKATVQAAIGGISLSLGLASGELILAIFALEILVTAPLGAVGIRKGAPLLLEKAPLAIISLGT